MAEGTTLINTQKHGNVDVSSIGVVTSIVTLAENGLKSTLANNLVITRAYFNSYHKCVLLMFPLCTYNTPVGLIFFVIYIFVQICLNHFVL